MGAYVTGILTTALTETTDGWLAAAFKKLFDVATPVFTAASVNQTADAATHIGVAGANLTNVQISGTKKTLDVLHDATQLVQRSEPPTVEQIRTEMEGTGTKLTEILADTAEIGTAGAGLTNVQVSGTKKTLDILHDATQLVQRSEPPTAESIAALVLATPAYKLVTDATGRVTVGSNADKTGYSGIVTDKTGFSLAVTPPTKSEIASEIMVTPANKLTTDLSGRVTVGSNADKTGYTATVSDKTGFSLIGDYDSAKTAATQSSVNTIDGIVDNIKLKTDLIPADPATNTQVNTRMATFTYTAPDNTSIGQIKTQTDKLIFSGTDVKATLDGESVLVSDKTGFSLIGDYDPAKTSAQEDNVEAHVISAIEASDIIDVEAVTDSLVEAVTDSLTESLTTAVTEGLVEGILNATIENNITVQEAVKRIMACIVNPAIMSQDGDYKVFDFKSSDGLETVVQQRITVDGETRELM